jgi:hypothetical protein
LVSVRCCSKVRMRAAVSSRSSIIGMALIGLGEPPGYRRARANSGSSPTPMAYCAPAARTACESTARRSACCPSRRRGPDGATLHRFLGEVGSDEFMNSGAVARGTVQVQSSVARMNANETLCSVSHSFDPIFAVAKESRMKRSERLRNIVLQR